MKKNIGEIFQAFEMVAQTGFASRRIKTR
jgi:hypothetical protein